MLFENREFKSENFSKKSLENQAFSSCTFTSCDFSEAVLWNARFASCIFTNCNLSLVKLDGCRLQEVRFIDCKIVGADWFKCEKLFFSVDFERCLLQFCNFSDLQMKNRSFLESKMLENTFTDTSLKGSDFGGTKLTGTVFHNCDLSNADFSSAAEYDIDPQTNNIKKAKFSLPEAVSLIKGLGVTIVS